MADVNDLYGKKTIPDQEIEKLIQESRIDLSVKIDQPPTILSVREVMGTTTKQIRLFTLGNFSCIIGKMKTKKTFLITLLTASLIRKASFSEKFYGELPIDRNKILYFDTEQGSYDSYNCVKRIERMSGNIENLKAFSLRAYSPELRCQIIEKLFETEGKEISYCVIDGIADLAFGINDEAEATRLSTMLLRLTKTYNCHITTVIHQNKQDNFATGHLGSAMMKKAEVVLSVQKNNKDRYHTDISSDYSRGPGFEPFVMAINDNGLPYIDEHGVANAHAEEDFSFTDNEGERLPQPTTDLPF